MPEESKTDAVEKLLSEEKAIEDRKQALIADLLKQKEAAIKDFDDKLAKLGYGPNNLGRAKRNHHKKAAAPSSEAAAKPAAKPKA